MADDLPIPETPEDVSGLFARKPFADDKTRFGVIRALIASAISRPGSVNVKLVWEEMGNGRGVVHNELEDIILKDPNGDVSITVPKRVLSARDAACLKQVDRYLRATERAESFTAKDISGLFAEKPVSTDKRRSEVIEPLTACAITCPGSVNVELVRRPATDAGSAAEGTGTKGSIASVILSDPNSDAHITVPNKAVNFFNLPAVFSMLVEAGDRTPDPERSAGGIIAGVLGGAAQESVQQHNK